ncbi:MAG: serine hydrolase [Phycisphaerales bacterium]|nr:MAG: serine hydrolase [Phycisphaerales bacterium]
MKHPDALPFAVALILLTTAAYCACGQPPEVDLEGHIDEFLGRIYKPADPGAAVIVVREGQVVYRRAFGMANLEMGVPLAADMVFAIGSATKPFTAMAVMMLAENGKLSLDDDITKHLPRFPTHDQKITIRHLLTHTSGLKRLHSIETYWERIREDITVDELLGVFKDHPLEFSPGEKSEYCNSGYYLLGRIIEKTSGQTYEQFVLENIFDRLGMVNTCFADNRKLIPRRVSGYHKEDGEYVNAPFMSYTHLYAAGAVMTNVEDLAKWSEALRSETLISKSGLEELFTPFVLNNGKPAERCPGWFSAEFGEHKAVYHGGGIFGFIVHTIYIPAKQLYIALLSNRIDRRANPPTRVVAERVMHMALSGSAEKMERKAIRLAPQELDRYTGSYKRSDSRGTQHLRTIVRDNGRLLFDSGPSGTFELLPESRSTFFIEGKQSIFTFEFGQSEEVVKMVLHLGGEGGRKIVFEKE